MKKLIFVAVAILVSACSTLKNPYFYSTEKNGIKSYIIGTASYGFGESELPKSVREKLAQATYFLTEYADNDNKNLKKQNRDYYFKGLQAAIRFNKIDEIRLSQNLSAKAWQSVRDGAKAIYKKPISDDELDYFSPSYAYDILLDSRGRRIFYVSQEEHYGFREHMNKDIYEDAVRQNRQILKFDLIRDTQKKCDDPKFIRLIEEYAAGEQINSKIGNETYYTAYSSGDEQALSNALNVGGSYDSLDGCVVQARSANWSDKISKTNNLGQPMFIAVDARYLIGEKGLLESLKAAGFTVNRFKP